MATTAESAPEWRRGLRPGAEAPPEPGRVGLGARIARLWGIEIVADWSLIVIFGLVTIQLGIGLLPMWHPSWGVGLVWGVALAAALLFFGSILLHELSHAVVARTVGIPVRRITLFLFGGMAHLEREPSSPKAELLTAIVGPIVSFSLGLGATLAGSLLAADAMALMPHHPELAYARLGPVATLLLWLGPVNIALAVFNLVPGFPLDGGRVLRALLWWGTGDLRKATRWASGVGRFFGIALVVFGLFTIFGGGLASGLWLALIGWFLHGAATMGYQQVVVRDALEGVSVGRLMRPRVDAVSPRASIERFVDEHVMTSEEHAFPVVVDGALIGLVAMHDVRKVPRAAWATTLVGEVMTPIEKLPMIDAEAPASEALEKLAGSEVDQLPVMRGGQVIGMVRRHDILKWIALTEPGLRA